VTKEHKFSFNESRRVVDDYTPETLKNIGKRFNITKEGVQQIENKALSILRFIANQERLKCFVE
jgi:DNA-directed RNA polymerase sigma subunit (sigma70/sigma32)